MGMTRTQKVRSAFGMVLLGAFGVLMAPAAHANAGVPMLFLLSPFLGLSLFPIIIGEGFLLSRRTRVGGVQPYVKSLVANLFSTLIGIPVSWVLMVTLEIILFWPHAMQLRNLDETSYSFLQLACCSAWMDNVPYNTLSWRIPAASIVLLLIFFVVSVYSEAIAYWLIDRKSGWKRAFHLSFQLNTLSYLCLLFIPVWLFWSHW